MKLSPADLPEGEVCHWHVLAGIHELMLTELNILHLGEAPPRRIHLWVADEEGLVAVLLVAIEKGSDLGDLQTMQGVLAVFSVLARMHPQDMDWVLGFERMTRGRLDKEGVRRWLRTEGPMLASWSGDMTDDAGHVFPTLPLFYVVSEHWGKEWLEYNPDLCIPIEDDMTAQQRLDFLDNFLRTYYPIAEE